MTWIKLEHTTPGKPEVLRLARLLGVSHDDAFGKVVRFWIWLDANSVDGHVDALVDADVDAVVTHPGFARALMTVGWLVLDEVCGCVTVPNFGRHNGESAKKRGQKTKRQAEWRAKVDAGVDAPVDAPVSTNAPLEQTRTTEEEEVGILPDASKTNQEPPKWVADLRAVASGSQVAADYVERIWTSVRLGKTPRACGPSLSMSVCGPKVKNKTGYLAKVVREFEGKYDGDILKRSIAK
jgi:hypothetical protein